MPTKPIPDGYHSVTPYLVVERAGELIAFLEQAFEGEVTERMIRPDGTIGHAEVRIGDSVIMLSNARDPWKPLQSALYLYVPDTDAVYQRALAAGATSIMEPVDQFYGDRNAGVQDFAGHVWWIGTRQEAVSREELERRALAQMK